VDAVMIITRCYVAIPLILLQEWRVFVRYGKILDVRPHKGDWKVHYDPK